MRRGVPGRGLAGLIIAAAALLLPASAGAITYAPMRNGLAVNAARR